MEDLLDATGAGAAGSNALYVTGGGSELPIVSRVLREQFGKRVQRSVHARSATALGLAIQADAQAGYVLREKFTRYFGVWREADAGQRILFDPLFQKGAALPGPGEGPLEILRCYRPVHNFGHFRYLECSHLDDECQPRGDVTVWDEIQFPFDPDLRDADSAPVEYSAAAPSQEIEETYSIDASGTVTITIANLSAGYERTYSLGRWAAKDAPVTPAKSTHAPHHQEAGRGPPPVSELLDVIRRHTVYDLAQPYFVGMPHFPTHPPYLFGLTRKHGDMLLEGKVSSSAEAIAFGGHVGTHIDALCHFSCEGKLHGGIQASAVQSSAGGFSELSVDTIAPILRRGVLLDIATEMKPQTNSDALPADFAITPEHLERALKTANTVVEPGDVVLLRTGWARFFPMHRAMLPVVRVDTR